MGQYLKIMVFADRVEIPSGRVGWNPLRESWMERGIQRQGRVESSQRELDGEKILRQERKNTKGRPCPL